MVRREAPTDVRDALAEPRTATEGGAASASRLRSRATQLGGVLVLAGAAVGVGWVAFRMLAKADKSEVFADAPVKDGPIVLKSPGDAERFVSVQGVVAVRTTTPVPAAPKKPGASAPPAESHVVAYIELAPDAWADLEKQLGRPKASFTRRMDDAEAERIMSRRAVEALPQENGQRVVLTAEYDITKLRRGLGVGTTGWRIGSVLMVWYTA